MMGRQSAVVAEVSRAEEEDAEPLAEKETANLKRLGFPYNVPSELSAEDGEAIEAIIAQGPPQWVLDLRKKLGK